MIYVIHRVDKNPGDFWSSPRHYFELPEYKLIDILDIRLLKKIPIGSKCIVGGGGLIKQIFAPSLNILFKKKCRIVFWGIGERMYQNVENKWLAEKQKKFISPHSFHPLLHLTGFRSLEPGIEWVPCASCNHPIFDLSKGREFESIKIFTHKKVLIDNPRGFSFLINEPVSIEAVIEYIASARILITNSYHGMYWVSCLAFLQYAFPSLRVIIHS